MIQHRKRMGLGTGAAIALSLAALLAQIQEAKATRSTLLRVMAGEQRPATGDVLLEGSSVFSLEPDQLAARRAVVPQATHLGFPFSAAEVVALGHSVPGFANDDHAYVQAALEKVGLGDIAQRSYQALSGGERQRVHFARALCQLASARNDTAQVLLLDEATSNLDLAHQLHVLAEVRQLSASGTAVIAVLPDWKLAARFSDRVL